MPSSSYQKGARLERCVKKSFEEKGYLVIRQGGSKFPDLIAIGHGRVLLIECKYRKKYMSRKETQLLFEMCNTYLATPVLAYVPDGVPMRNFIAENMIELSIVV